MAALLIQVIFSWFFLASCLSYCSLSLLFPVLGTVAQKTVSCQVEYMSFAFYTVTMYLILNLHVYLLKLRLLPSE